MRFPHKFYEDMFKQTQEINNNSRLTILWTERTPVNGTAFYENNARTDKTPVNGISGVDKTKLGQRDSQSENKAWTDRQSE